ncbi:unnamed protein product, partial [Gulo gulo]
MIPSTVVNCYVQTPPEVCNSTTAEINQLLFLQALEDSTPLASTAPVTSSLFALSPDFSVVPLGE